MELSQNRCEHGQLIIPKSVREELFTFSLRYKSQLDPPQVHPVHPSDRLLVALFIFYMMMTAVCLYSIWWSHTPPTRTTHPTGKDHIWGCHDAILTNFFWLSVGPCPVPVGLNGLSVAQLMKCFATNYGFWVAHWKQRGFTETDGTTIQHLDQIKLLLAALMKPKHIGICKCKAL